LIIFSDEMNHASMISGIQRSRCDKVIFKHNDLADLEAKLKATPADMPKLIAFESVYSMDADIAPIADSHITDAVRSLASGFIFTTSIPPSTAAGALRSVRYLKLTPNVREQHQDRANALKARFRKAGFPFIDGETHIVPLMVGDPVKCKAISDALIERFGLYVQPINYPTVPRGTERLRFTPSPFHTDAMMDELMGALETVWSEFSLKRVEAA